MATTVTPANLTVTITEQYTLNNVAYGNTINKTFTTNGEIYQRIMAVKQSEVTELIAFGAADGLGTVDKSNYTYFRITNLDDTNFLTLTITSGDTFFYKLKAGESLLLMDNEMDAIASSTTFGAFADITSIKAQADTDGVDVELMCVTV
ncbi:MAG: hypothetical protein CMD14_02380 [Flavobacteriales bacterium]|jgi:hypothetical protein|nr:hypothetical protein [Flavobacteriales bacterium]